MAEVTVAELADEVRTPVERLLKQMNEAGLPHSSSDESVSEEQKRELLNHLEQVHGGPSDSGPTKITLNRTRVTRLRAGSGRKTVAVVAKKKRTYIKRGDADGEAEAPAADGAVAETAVAAEASSAEAKAAAEAIAAAEAKAVADAQAAAEALAAAEAAAAAEAKAAAAKSAPKAPARPVGQGTADHRAAIKAEDDARRATMDAEAAVAAAKVQKAADAVADAERVAAEAAAASATAAAAAEQASSEVAAAVAPDADAADAEPEAKPGEKITGKRIVRRRVATGLAAERERFRQEEQGRLDALAASRQQEQERKQRMADEVERKKQEAERKKADAEAVRQKAAVVPAAADAPPPPPADAENAKPGKRSDDRRGKRGGSERGRRDDEGSRRRKEGTLSRLDSRARRRSRQHRPDVPRGQHGFTTPTETIVREVAVPEAITVGDLAQRMSVKAGEVIKILMGMGVMATINQMLDQDTASLLVEEVGHKVVTVSATAIEDALVDSVKTEGDEVIRPPVVTVMGHVDHGKTSLLDYIREAKVASGEAGGITQHIGAYHVVTERGGITFVDTPGHAAFTAMRARGAKVTDVVILVVAADDGVMPQTVEAVQHAKAAGVPIVVAVNKIDKEGADPDRVRNELSAKDVIPEAWGGDVPFINVSAHTGEGVDELLEAVLLQAELLELKAVPKAPASGVVIESKLERGRGPVATILIQNGTLRRGDIVIAGEQYGRVRAMVDDAGGQPTEVGPAMPVEILGLDGTPGAGDEFLVVPDERKAREVAEFRETRSTENRLAAQQASKLENMFANLKDGEKRIMNVVLKTDVRGSLEAIIAAIAELSNDEVGVNMVGTGVGGITESDANLAVTSGAALIGFNVRADNAAKKVIDREGPDLRYYSVIYELLDDIKSALEGMLSPEVRENIVGIAEVREVFRSPKFGDIAGSLVIEGTVHKSKPIRVLREDVVIYEGELESLRRFKDDVNEVKNGMECGIGVRNYKDVRPGDRIEVFERKEVARTL